MTLLKNIKKTKQGMYFAIIGIFLAILFVNLVVIHHVNTLKIKNTFSTFTANSFYEITYHTTKQNTKRKLFDYQNYHFYSYGVNDIKIDYKGLEMNLRTTLKEEYFSFESFLENFQFVYETEDKRVVRYDSENLEITMFKLKEDYIDVIFSLKGLRKPFLFCINLFRLQK